MSYEATILAELADVARAKGLASVSVTYAGSTYAFTIGPEPSKLQQLRAITEPTDGEKIELAREEREARIADAREDMREQLAHNGRAYSDEQIDAMLDPAVLR